ncbi:MAG TPA: hypothetical protein VIK91_17910 [Nannocystis sp.]
MLAVTLGCARVGARSDDRGDVEIAERPLADDQVARLLALARAQGHLYWRLPGDAGPRCEPWRLLPGDDGPEHGHLVFTASAGALDHPAQDPPAPRDEDPADGRHAAALPDSPTNVPEDMSESPSTLRLAYRVADGHFSLTSPEHERPLLAAPGARQDLGRALTCVFTGIAVTDPGRAIRRVVLVARERFFFTADACAAAGPADDPPGPDELRALGCAAALADPATRARLDRPPPTDAPDPAGGLLRARRIHVLRRGVDGQPRCDAWHNYPEAGGHGQLVHRGRDERGDFTWTYAYDVGPGYVTLHGPAERRSVDLAGRRADVVRASGCLLTRSVAAVTPAALTIGEEQWYLSKRACERARRAFRGAPAETTPLLVPACE